MSRNFLHDKVIAAEILLLQARPFPHRSKPMSPSCLTSGLLVGERPFKLGYGDGVTKDVLLDCSDSGLLLLKP
jgi:hypothetical protein